MTKLLASAVVLVGVLAAGCTPQMAWQRMDGGPVYGYGFERAMSHCRGRAMDNDEAAAQVMRRCMARHGFVWAPRSSSGPY